jgi:phenol 2-monooxygenase
MQFHLNGFTAGDPDLAPSALSSGTTSHSGNLPETVDVLIVGCGPAGLTLAAQLAAFPEIDTRIVEHKPGPLTLGQADGIACRTVEMFQAFGFAERVLREAYWVNETSFWKPDVAQPDRIVRNGRILDVEEGLSEFPHVILNQARVHEFYLDFMRKSPRRLAPDYNRRFLDFVVDTEGSHPVTVRLERTDAGHQGEIETIQARYVVGCDGAHSMVRKSLGLELHGDSANQAWGVMDVLAVTDFPDIRLKGIIQSAAEGSIVLIPREGGYLIRVYVELGKLSENERVAGRSLTVDRLIAAAQRILNPYRFEVKEVAWWSVYEIGQRLCDRFDDVPVDAEASRLPRVFIAGDACHTHSPKAGQGMNVSMQDAFNLGWKLAAVMRGTSRPGLLRSYSAERRAIAKELIDFDREWAGMLSAPLKSGAGDGIDPTEVQSYFVRHGHYTAGTATRYAPSILTGAPTHQALANGFPIGTRFHSAPVIRLGDAKPMQLGHAAEADGRWRLFAFVDREGLSGWKIAALCKFLQESEDSPIRRHTPEGWDLDAVIDTRAIFQEEHRGVALGDLPPLLLPAKGRLGLRDYEKAFCPDLTGGKDIFDMRQINRTDGCMVVVRPDQYVAHIAPLDAYKELSTFFAGFMINRMSGGHCPQARA